MVFDRTQRPIVPDSHPDEREHRRMLAVRASASMPKDGTERMVAPLKMQQYATASLPDATLWEGSIVHQSDDAAPAFSDGVDWTTLATKDSVTTVASDLATLTTLVDTLDPPAWIIVPKTSDEARTNNTLANDGALTFAVAASTKYRFRIQAFYNSTATPDFKFDVNGPAAATKIFWRYRWILDNDNQDEGFETAFATLVSILDTVTVNGIILIEGMLQNGANAGTVAFRWAQSTTNATATTVYAGSFLEYQTV